MKFNTQFGAFWRRINDPSVSTSGNIFGSAEGAMTSDVNFHEIFGVKYYMKSIFLLTSYTLTMF